MSRCSRDSSTGSFCRCFCFFFFETQLRLSFFSIFFYCFLTTVTRWRQCRICLHRPTQHCIIIVLLSHLPLRYSYFLYSAAPQQLSLHTHLWCGKATFQGSLTTAFVSVIVFGCYINFNCFLLIVTLPIIYIYTVITIKCPSFRNYAVSSACK